MFLFRCMVRWSLAFIVWFVCWVGSAQLAVFIFGPDNDVILIPAMLGMGWGIWFGLSIGFAKNPITLEDWYIPYLIDPK